MAVLSPTDLEKIKEEKVKLMQDFLGMEPPKCKGDDLIEFWSMLYDADMRAATVENFQGESNGGENLVFPYQQIRAVVGDGGNWKWPRMWQRLDEIERRGIAYREGEITNFQGANKNPNIISQKCLVVGGGPIGMRMAIELRIGGHEVILIEKRKEIRDAAGELTQLGFTNRINRPHMWAYVRNDLEKFNGKDFMSRQACYPVFTEPDTSSIGIDELQLLLLKNVLMLGVEVRLGAGFEDAEAIVHPKTCKPQWKCKIKYDAQCAQQFGKDVGDNFEIYDCLIGCDGPRSTVRETQSKQFGNIEKRKFMDCVGIVANVRKLERSRLKELNFPHGQEPPDMNRTKMVFGEFFEKLATEAEADLQNFIYYKASFHNYIIITPSRANLIQHGLSGKVYSFAAARGAAAQQMKEEKEKLRKYVGKVLDVGGIPVDKELPNGGFVDPPNDCMAFDFAECWNTKISLQFNLAPPDYDVEEHGPWMGKTLTPFICLAGDALLEPFWPLGLGLKRGWQAVMDSSYAVDNLYNRTLELDSLERADDPNLVNQDPDEFSWDMHWDILKERCRENFEGCSRVEVAEEIGKGEYTANGLVMVQWKKMYAEMERPLYLVEIDPNTRYKKRNLALISKLKRKMLDEPKWVHNVVSRQYNILDYVEKCKKDEKYRGWNNLKSYGGKKIGEAAKSGYAFKAPAKKDPEKKVLLPAEIAAVAERKRSSLKEKVMQGALDSAIQAKSEEKKTDFGKTQQAMLASLLKGGAAVKNVEEIHDLAYKPPESEGLAESSNAMWDRATETLSPEKKAELENTRALLTKMRSKLAAYKEAESKILRGQDVDMMKLMML